MARYQGDRSGMLSLGVSARIRGKGRGEVEYHFRGELDTPENYDMRIYT